MVGDGEPSQVPIPALDDPIVSEDALKAEPKLFGKLDRGQIEFVGGPLQTPITKKQVNLSRLKSQSPILRGAPWFESPFFR